MKYKLKVYSIWEFGQRKDSQGNPHQEDSIFPDSERLSDDDRLFILCDGMGGHDAGEVASATVCEAMSQSILYDGHDNVGIFTHNDFSNALNAAFGALDKKDSGAEKKMGTTMTFLKLYERGAFIAHIGDSRVYQIRPGKTGEETQIIFQTEDHSLVNDLIKVGELTKEEARLSKQRNVITRALQPNMKRRPKADVYETSDIKAGDYFYMCSDGMLEQEEMENGESLKNIFSEMGGTDENKIEILKSVTEKNRDNHTAFIIHILEVEDPIEKTLIENATTSPIDDKFTAIVEEDTDKAEVESDNTRSEFVRNQGSKEDGSPEMRLQGDHNLLIEKSEQSPQVTLTNVKKKILTEKYLYSNRIKYIVAAIVVMLIIFGINCFRLCSTHNSTIVKEKLETPDKIPSPASNTPKKNPPKKVNGATSTGSTTEVTTQTAADAINSTSANQLESTENPSQNQVSETGPIQLPSKKDQMDDVVESDQQLIQNIKKHSKH